MKVLWSLIHPARYHGVDMAIGNRTLAIPLYAAAISALFLLFRPLTRSGQTTRDRNVTQKSWKDTAIYRGGVVLIYNLFRLVACLSLLALSVASFIISRSRKEADEADRELKLAFCVFYIYASLLAAAAIGVSTKCGRHLDVILAVAFAVYFHRDIFPLATYTWPVQDAAEGAILYVKLVALTLAAVIIPLVTPRTYIPVDPKKPMSEPNPEQTASPLSLLLFGFLDPLVLLAYKLPHLPYELLPPLADTDDAQNLKTRAFPSMDTFSGASRRHIFFGIMKTYRKEYISMFLLLVAYNVVWFAVPIGTNRLLSYLENGPGDSSVRPFVWILSLALGPFVTGALYHAYYNLSLRSLVQLEGILTQLIFEHALRVRVKAHTPEGDTPTSPPLAEAASSSNDSPQRATVPVRSGIDTGKISNLVTTDLRNVARMTDFMMLLFGMPMSTVFGVVFLYLLLGWSSFIGLATMLALFPISGMASQLQHGIQKGRSKAADARIGVISETINVLRMIKLFAWEGKMLERVNEKREAELNWIWKREIFQLIAIIVRHTVVMKQELRPSIVFSTIPVFNLLRAQLERTNYRITQFIDGKVSLDRINDFLHNTELLDSFTEDELATDVLTADASTDIGFRDAIFHWSNNEDGTATPTKYNFALRIEDELLFKRGCINLVLGPTGAGKTSLLLALLGEMHFTPSSPRSWYNLPRAGGVAYAAQESWILNQTIRDNILFGSEYDEERYKKVLYQCALERDLELFEAGDKSEVGEKGLTLSGGQKARCTLARAIYSTADILLLDDVLAALDVHTSKWIVEKCFTGDLVQGRTIILVSHNVAIVAPIADFTVLIGLDGRILSQGSVAEALQRDVVLAKEANTDLQVIEQAVVDIDRVDAKTTAEGKLILAEEMQLGRVKWSAVALYLNGLGGAGFHTIFLGFYVISQLAKVLEIWYLGYFASVYETSAPGTVSVSYHLGIYGLIILLDIVTHSYADVIFAYAVLRASRSIHRKLIESILGTTLRWLDITPVSRVIARFTTDISTVDGVTIEVFSSFIQDTISIFISFGAVVLLTPLFSVPGVLAAIIGGALGQMFVKAQLSVKRETSNAKAPVLGHITAAIAGLTSIRAYGAQGPFIEESLRRINRYTRATRTLVSLDRWVGIRLAGISNVLVAILATYLVYFHKERSNNVGFSLNQAVQFSMRVLAWVRGWNEVQVQGISLERIQQYMEIEQEPKPTETGRPPAHWPRSGELVVEKLSARYSDGPKVLLDISFRVNSGERIGVVGRTGSGKSSLTLALLRCIPTDGTVLFDGISIASVNLDALRSKITILPQMPELLSGTLRHNLDPFDQYDDLTLNDALRAAGLFALQEEMEEGQLVLDSPISSGGQNLSVGQRQILALARAILRDSKLLILDEATSAIDYKTDAIIQTSLRNELKSDVTVITIAHRLETILDSDKIMVLDEGRIVEFDAPNVLLKNPQGKLRALVDESGNKQKLHAMAEGKRH
ncbi:P-loop containing nucleoside triphosphate hydrolase protein [Mycena latifolia]|nr:P-loop containing nucleoside triphosphate hydrolase protein [Mycena latifolia]